MNNLTPASLEIVNNVLRNVSLVHEDAREYFQALRYNILPMLENEKDLARKLVISMLNYMNADYSEGCLDDTDILNDIIINHFDLLDDSAVRQLMRRSNDINLSPSALAKVVEFGLSDVRKWINYLRKPDCLVNTGDSSYDFNLRERMVSYLKFTKLPNSNINEIIYVHENPVYKTEDYTKFKGVFEPMLHISSMFNLQNPMMDFILNRYFKDWALKYMQDFYYTEIIINKNVDADNFKISTILAFNTSVRDDVREHARKSLAQKDFTNEMKFLHELQSKKWVDDLENFYKTFLNEENWKYFEYHAKGDFSRKLPHKWLIKNFNLTMDDSPDVWEGFSELENYIFIIRRYKKYHTSDQLRTLKADILSFLSQQHSIDIEPNVCSVDILCSILETLVEE